MKTQFTINNSGSPLALSALRSFSEVGCIEWVRAFSTSSLVTIALAWHGANYSSCATVSSSGATADILNTQVTIVQAPPQFTNVTVVNNANAGTLCTTSLNVTDSTIVLDTLTPGQYDNLHDYNTILRSNRSIFPTFGNELVTTPTDAAILFNAFGSVVALSGDGSVIAVGENAAQPGSGTTSTVYIYRRQNNTWVLQQRLTNPGPSNPVPGRTIGFGFSLALSYDGSILVVGSPLIGGTSTSATVDKVFVYGYQPQVGQWKLAQTIIAASSCGFGNTVGISATGQYIIAYQNGTFANASNLSPLLLVYERQPTCSSSTSWQQVAALTPLDILGHSISTFGGGTFSIEAAISADGSTVTISYITPGANTQLTIFKQQGGSWQQTQTIAPSGISDHIPSVALSANGKYLAVGASGQSINGQVYIFAQRGSLYEQEAFFQNATPSFGTAVSLSADGTMLVVGSGSGILPPLSSGVYVFLRGPDNRWSQQSLLTASGGDTLGFACAVSADGNIIAAGAPGWPGGNGTGYLAIFSPVGSFIPNDTVVSGSLCVYHQTTVDANLKVVGNIHVQNTIVTGTAGHAVACTAPSDGRVKDNIRSLDPQRAWEVIRSLRPVEFHWNNKPDPFDTKLLRNFTQGERAGIFARTECFSQHSGEKCIERMSEAIRHAGFVAQELEKQFPHWVTTELSPDGNVKMIYLHHELYAYLVTAVLDAAQRTQHQQEKVENLQLTKP